MQLYLQVENLRRSSARQSAVDRIDSLFRERYGNVSLDLGTHITSVELPVLELQEEKDSKNLSAHKTASGEVGEP